MAEFDASKMKELGKEASKEGNRYLNVVAYSYNDGEPKISIRPKTQNTNNPDQWISQKSISGLNKAEALALAKNLEKVAQAYL